MEETKRSDLKVDTIYFIEKSEMYAVTVDGIGMTYYSEMEDAEDETGTEFDPNNTIEALSDWA